MYDTVLVPTDGTGGADQAVERAVDFARRYDATLHALAMVETDAGDGRSASAVGDTPEATGEAAVADVVDRANDAGVDDVETAVERGVSHEVVRRYVDDNDVDLVVMGTHGERSEMDRYRLGSVAEAVVEHATVPVVTVPLADDGG